MRSAHWALSHDNNGVVRVTRGSVDLFEGTSTNTTDLDDSAAFGNMILFPLASGTRNIHVQNWAEGQPDDKADVTLTLRN
jgi:hypothetical protein